jgi:hypothetical protein
MQKNSKILATFYEVKITVKGAVNIFENYRKLSKIIEKTIKTIKKTSVIKTKGDFLYLCY